MKAEDSFAEDQYYFKTTSGPSYPPPVVGRTVQVVVMQSRATSQSGAIANSKGS